MTTTSRKPVESDHEFRTRMAAEGKAIYVPGKTVEEVKAERDARRSRTITLTLTAEQAEVFQRAAFDVAIAATQAENAFIFMGKVVSGGDHEGEIGIGDALQLMGRGMGFFGERGDTEDLQELSDLIKKAGGKA